jgi:hypothetical protein
MADQLPTNEDDELEVLPDEEEFFEEEFEDTEDSKLTGKQILSLVLAGLVGFFLFLFFLFPLEDIIRSYAVKYASEAGVNLDFKNLNFPLFSRKQIDGLFVLTRGNTEIKSEEVEMDFSILALRKNQIQGDLEATSFQIDMGNIIVKLRKMNLILNINNYDKGANFTGNIELQTGSGQIVKLPNFPFLGDLSGTGIKGLSLQFKKNGQTLLIEKGIINLSIAKITVRGKMEVVGSFMNSSLGIEICPKLTPEFSAEREDLANTIAAVSRDGEACIPIKGTLSEPQADLSKIMGGGQGTPPTQPDSGAP